MTASRVLSVEGAKVSFGGVAAINGIELNVDDNEVLAIVGPNGSGKTVFLNAITGFVRLDEGKIHLWGQDVTKLRAHQRAHLGLGRTFQNLRVVPRVTVAELLQFGWHQRDPRNFALSIARPFWAQRSTRNVLVEAAAALERVGVPRTLLETRVTSLSQGQLKLVDVARALMARPRLLLLDEPTSGLNEDDVVYMRQLVTTLKADGITLVVVEHDVRFVLAFADRVAVFENGRLLAIGDPATTMRLPEVVDAYLGPRGRINEVDEGPETKAVPSTGDA
jgi:ABC-type branched-subunit amino acid transport system ATPase component